MIAGNYTETTRDAWLTVPGRSYNCEYDSAGRLLSITYYSGVNALFTQQFTYNTAGKITRAVCINPPTNVNN